MCVFCKIIDREIPSTVVYEDELVMAILDINPLTEGHTLVFPKVHVEDLFDCPPDTFEYLSRIVQQVAIDTQLQYQANGFNLLQNSKAVSGQIIPHLHFHLIPRYQENELVILKKDSEQ